MAETPRAVDADFTDLSTWSGLSLVSLRFNVPEEPRLEERFIAEFHELRVKWDLRWSLIGLALGLSVLARSGGISLLSSTTALVLLRGVPALAMLLLPSKSYCKWRRTLMIGMRCMRCALILQNLRVAGGLQPGLPSSCHALFITLSESGSALFIMGYQLPFKDSSLWDALAMAPIVVRLAASRGMCALLLRQAPLSPCARLASAYGAACYWVSSLAALLGGVPTDSSRCDRDLEQVCAHMSLYLVLLMGWMLPTLLLYMSELRTRSAILAARADHPGAAPTALQVQFWLCQNFVLALMLLVAFWAAVPHAVQWMV